MAMTLMIITAILGAWAALSLFGGEMQRQRQNLELVREMEARLAAKRAAEAARIVEVTESKSRAFRK